MSTLSPPCTPFQRIADALSAEPHREFATHDLARAGQCVSTVAVLCAQRLQDERQVTRRIDSGGRSWWHWVGVRR